MNVTNFSNFSKNHKKSKKNIKNKKSNKNKNRDITYTEGFLKIATYNIRDLIMKLNKKYSEHSIKKTKQT